MKAFGDTFVKYDANKSGDLDGTYSNCSGFGGCMTARCCLSSRSEFELNKMYEGRGEAKTSSELKELIKVRRVLVVSSTLQPND
jgi:hypothetical protein